MIMRKGSRYVFCKKCNKKRYCNTLPISYFYKQFTCSKGHTWEVELSTIEKITKSQIGMLLSNIEKLFGVDDPFYSSLREKR